MSCRHLRLRVQSDGGETEETCKPTAVTSSSLDALLGSLALMTLPAALDGGSRRHTHRNMHQGIAEQLSVPNRLPLATRSMCPWDCDFGGGAARGVRSERDCCTTF